MGLEYVISDERSSRVAGLGQGQAGGLVLAGQQNETEQRPAPQNPNPHRTHRPVRVRRHGVVVTVKIVR
jgi:hypothetical protein